MISTVKKIYLETPNGEEHIIYKLTYENGEIWDVPHSEDNRHYQEILEWVENGGVIVDNGA
jgi:antitoxin component YwqK of YwqJK toxin-antitoxin module